jgi:serine/threonine protein kinase
MPKDSRYTDEERTIVDLKVGAALPSGHRLQEFVIEGVLGLGGFGIVYRARDTRLQRNVALKEYMPSSLAARSADYNVTALSDWQRETFATGLRSFVNEAQLLASFDHPSLVKVHRFWEENGTAYMVMPLYKGVTLKRWLRENGPLPDQAWLLALLMPLIDALEQLHNADPCCLHRDVAPDNVLLLESARGDASSPQALRPLLLDFGAARRVIGDMTRTLTVFLKPGYAPIEQYGDSITSRQGPWTDVYALSAVLYACITGHAPVASVDRVLHDDLAPAAEVGAGRYTPGFLAAIDAGLSVRPEGRPASMAEFRRCFVADVPVLSPLADGIGLGSTPSEAASKSTQVLGEPAAAAYHATRVVPPPRIIHRGRWAVAAVSLAVIAALGWWVQRPAATVRPPLAGGTSGTGTTGGQTTVLPAETAGATQMPSGGAVPAPSAPPFGVLAALQDILERADASIRVGASVDKLTLVIGKDSMRFRVKSSEPGYVYVFSGGTDKRHFNLLFPNRLDKAHRIEANTELALPRPSWEIVAGGPPGTNHLVVLVSRHERNLSQAGLRQTDEPIPEFDLVQAERLWKAKADGSNPFVGEPVCAPTVACSAAYGATMLVVDETAAPARK